MGEKDELALKEAHKLTMDKLEKEKKKIENDLTR
jgi:hypothetical protein